MSNTNFYKTTIRLDKITYDKLNEISENRQEPLANIIREYIKKGLAKEYIEDSKDIIASVVREQVELVIKPHVERLAKISSKSGHMSGTAAFLNVQALMELVPKEQKRSVREMYNKARKMAVEYMRSKTEDWDNNID